MTAAGASVLAYRGRMLAAVAGVLVGVAVLGLVAPVWLVFALPAASAVLLAVALLRTRSAQLVAAALIGVIMAAAVAADALLARAEGLSLVAALRADAAASAAALSESLGTAGQGLTEQIELARATLVTLAPGLYFQTALLGAVLVIAAVSWGARRSGADLGVPRIRDLDLSVHVLWGLLAGLVALAAARIMGDDAATLQAVGINLLFCVRSLFFLQGIAVFSAIFDVPKTGRAKMLVLYFALWVLDQLLLVVSLVGLVDFWANFRRLPRDGATAEGVPESRST